MPRHTSQHILPTAANLLGFCLFVITSLHISNSAASSLIDEFTSLIALLLGLACLFSFMSIRWKGSDKEPRLEAIADVLFMISMAGILVIILLLVCNIIK